MRRGKGQHRRSSLDWELLVAFSTLSLSPMSLLAHHSDESLLSTYCVFTAVEHMRACQKLSSCSYRYSYFGNLSAGEAQGREISRVNRTGFTGEMAFVMGPTEMTC